MTRRIRAGALPMLCAVGLALAGCGEDDFENEPRPPVPKQLTGVLTQPDTLDMSSTEIGMIASIYLVGQVIGALVFGRIGDLIGRKYTFLVTIVTMGLSTAFIGFLPTYASIGVWAPILLVTLRLAQGLALGGEYGGAATYVAEHVPDERRGYYTSFIQTTATLGFFVSLAVIGACRLGNSPATAEPLDPRRLRFSPLGNDTPLFTCPAPETHITPLAEPINLHRGAGQPFHGPNSFFLIFRWSVSLVWSIFTSNSHLSTRTRIAPFRSNRG